MSTAVLGQSDLSIPDKILDTRTKVKAMTGNTDYPTPIPALADVTDAVNNLETAANNAAGGGVSLTAIMHEKETILDGQMKQLTAYVQSASGGDADKIRNAAFNVRKSKTPPPDMVQVTGLSAKTTDNEGEIALKWKKVNKSKAYTIQQSADGSTAWTQACDDCTITKTTITDLASGTIKWFRVAAIGANGRGPWSNPAKGTAK